jgi:hypothetical protein
MPDLDLTQPAIVFWMTGSGGITRFERLSDAIQAIMQAPSAKTSSIAWIHTKDRHLAMDDIRSIAKRFSLTWRLSQVVECVGETTAAIKAMDHPKRRRRRWSLSSVPQS